METVDVRELATEVFKNAPGFGAACREALSETLRALGHEEEPVLRTMRSSKSEEYRCIGLSTEDYSQQWLAGENEATEHAAVGVATLVCCRAWGSAKVQREYRGSGFDYYLVDASEVSPANPLAGVGLEISGIYKGTEADIRERIRRKRQQCEEGTSRINQWIVFVTEFSSLQATIEDVSR